MPIKEHFASARAVFRQANFAEGVARAEFATHHLGVVPGRNCITVGAGAGTEDFRHVVGDSCLIKKLLL